MKVRDIMLPHRLELIPVYQLNDQGSSDLARHLHEAANFATYFEASPVAQLMPHLYISSVMMWLQDSTMSKHYAPQTPLFLLGPQQNRLVAHFLSNKTISLQ